MDRDAKDFYDKYQEPFLGLLEIPLITTCLYQKDYVPYEYSPYNSPLRNWRSNKEVDSYLSQHRFFMLYCYKEHIPKRFLQIIAGGNLLLFYKYKMHFSKHE